MHVVTVFFYSYIYHAYYSISRNAELKSRVAFGLSSAEGLTKMSIQPVVLYTVGLMWSFIEGHSQNVETLSLNLHEE